MTCQVITHRAERPRYNQDDCWWQDTSGADLCLVWADPALQHHQQSKCTQFEQQTLHPLYLNVRSMQEYLLLGQATVHVKTHPDTTYGMLWSSTHHCVVRSAWQ